MRKSTYFNIFLLLTSFIFLPLQLHADPVKNPSAWTGNVQFGYSGTGGNSDDLNLTSRLNFQYKKSDWTNTYKLSSFYSKNDSIVTALHYEGNFKWNYSFTKNTFVFLSNDNIYDEFNPYDLSITTASGIGYRLINADKVSLDIQGGPGYRYARVNTTQATEENMIGYAATTLNWTISKSSSFQQTLSADIGNNNTVTKSESALTMDIIGNLGLQLSYTLTHNSTIPAGSAKTQKIDYRTDVTLLFSF